MPFRGRGSQQIVAAIGTLDAELLLILNEGRLILDDIPEAVPA